MAYGDPQIGEILSPPVIRALDQAAINRIAAGEVVERPASAVKELVENALDAGARRVEVAYADGGKTLLRVMDDGHGMRAEDLPLALAHHATSKIDGSDLLNIHSFGFRGEALPSLGAVGRLEIISRARGADSANKIVVHGSEHEAVRPAALSAGTVVTLRDLFSATPARLKFLRSDRAEAQAIHDVVKRIALAQPQVGFVLRDMTGGGEGREILRAPAEDGDLFDALRRRVGRIMGTAFVDNAVSVDADRDGIALTGFAGLPTYSRGAAVAQFMYVNGRPVKDKQLTGALRAAYSDFLSRDRHPAAVLFIECAAELVDVNVHPAKAEVRFRDPGLVRGLIVTGLRHALAEAGHRASSTVADATLGAFRAEPDPAPARVYQMDFASRPAAPRAAPLQEMPGFSEAPSARVEPDTVVGPDAPLGAARAQVHENYIIAQTKDGLVIVDQHAAHERLVYENLKRQMAENGVPRQALLIPDIVDLSPSDLDRILAHADDLARFGVILDGFGQGAIAIREVPAILGQVDGAALVADILDELSDLGATHTLSDRIEAILSRMACHGSVRSGRRMSADEMNSLLREMEATPHSGQCNHGRPTYVELKLTDIERLFGRT